MDIKPLLLHDDFIDKVRVLMNEIKVLEHKNNKIGVVIKTLELANLRVSYYEQFYKNNNYNSLYYKIFKDDYESAVSYRATILDKAHELGIENE